MPLYAVVLASSLLGAQLSSEDFDRKIAKLSAQAGPGVAMAVYKDGKPLYEKAFGLADVAKNEPYRVDTSFEIGSLSKQFTATAILMLVKEGKVELRKPIGTYLPDLPAAWKPATVEQVLHHMSGIPDYEEIAGYDFYNQERKPIDVIEQAAKKPMDFKPGGGFYYSNTGYFLLGLIVEKTSGVPIGDFLEQRVFRPVGMTSTYAVHRPSGLHLATGYHSRTGVQTAQPPIAWSSTLAAGGIVSTLADMSRWDQALYTKKLLPDNLRNLLWSRSKTTSGERVDYGFGWFSGNFRGLERKDHSGQTNGFTCFYLRFPAQHLMVMVQTNTYGGRAGSIASSLAAHFLPGANFLAKPVPKDKNPKRSGEQVALLRSTLAGQGDKDRLSPSMNDWATQDRFKSAREELRKDLGETDVVRFLTEWSVLREDGVKTEFVVYRQEKAGKPQFWTLRFTGGKLVGFNLEDE